MITKDEIYPGARVIYEDPDYLYDRPISGTVTYFESLGNGNGPFDYIIYFLPDAEFEEYILKQDNHLYGLQTLFPFMANLLPQMNNISNDPPHIIENFTIQIDIERKARGNNLSEKIDFFYKDILLMFRLYGFEIKREEKYVAPQAIKNGQKIYCHYMELSGKCRPSEFIVLEKMLNYCNSFDILSIKKEQLLDCTKEEEFAEYHKRYDQNIIQNILKTFDTKGVSYKYDQNGIKEISNSIKIKTLDNYMSESRNNVNFIYVEDVYKKMKEQGMFEINPDYPYGERFECIRSAINLETLKYNGELLLSVKDKSKISDEMYLTALKSSYRVLHILPEHLKTHIFLKSLVQEHDYILQFIEKGRRNRHLCMQVLNAALNAEDLNYPMLVTTAIKYLQAMDINFNNERINIKIHQANLNNIAILLGDRKSPSISKQERIDIINLIDNAFNCKAVYKDLPNERKTKVVSNFAFSLDPYSLLYVPFDNLSDSLIKNALLYNGTSLLNLHPGSINNDLRLYALEHCHENDPLSSKVFGLFPRNLKTQENCILAVQKSPYAIEHVPSDFLGYDTIAAAIRSCRNENDWKALQDSSNPRIHSLVLKSNLVDPLTYIQLIPTNSINDEIAFSAIDQNGECIRYIPAEKQSTELIIAAIENNKDASILTYHNINQKLINEDVYKSAIEVDPDAFRYIPAQRITSECCIPSMDFHSEKKENMSTDLPQKTNFSQSNSIKKNSSSHRNN